MKRIIKYRTVISICLLVGIMFLFPGCTPNNDKKTPDSKPATLFRMWREDEETQFDLDQDVPIEIRLESRSDKDTLEHGDANMLSSPFTFIIRAKPVEGDTLQEVFSEGRSFYSRLHEEPFGSFEDCVVLATIDNFYGVIDMVEPVVLPHALFAGTKGCINIAAYYYGVTNGFCIYYEKKDNKLILESVKEFTGETGNEDVISILAEEE